MRGFNVTRRVATDKSEVEALVRHIAVNLENERSMLCFAPRVLQGFDWFHLNVAPPILRTASFAVIDGATSHYDANHYLKRFKDGHLDVLIADTHYAVGVNFGGHCKTLIVFEPEVLGRAHVEQIHGRILRVPNGSYTIWHVPGYAMEGSW